MGAWKNRLRKTHILQLSRRRKKKQLHSPLYFSVLLIVNKHVYVVMNVLVTQHGSVMMFFDGEKKTMTWQEFYLNNLLELFDRDFLS